tara:strand:+ start:3204 stop:4007 length:804 start_codon:yes stop_codon:yes gene_type:complete
MSEDSNLIETLKDMMPELKEGIDKSDIDTNKELEILKNEIEGLKGTLSNVTAALEKTVSLYNDACLEIKQAKLIAATQDQTKVSLTKSIVSQMISLLEIDYNKFTKGLLQETDLNEEVILQRVEKAIKEVGDTDNVIQVLANKLETKAVGALQQLLSDMDIDASDIAESMDYEDIASNLCYSTLSDYLSFDPTDYWDGSDLAQYFSESDIADYVCAATVAEHMDTDDIAHNVDEDAVASNIDLEQLASFIDLDELAQKVAEARGEAE